MSANFLDPRLPDRFWSKIVPEPNSGCWLWTGAVRQRTGYGHWSVGRRADGSDLAHRHAYRSLIGAVPEGTELDHRCRVRVCCNPAHLEPVTHQINVLRGESPSAHNAEKTHCPHGHPYDEHNTIVLGSKGGRNRGRKCRTCSAVACADYKRRQRQKGIRDA